MEFTGDAVMKRMLLIVNPNAGRGAYADGFTEALTYICENGYDVNIRFTKGPKDATQIAKNLSPMYDVVVCLGGDGTLSEVAAGMVEAEKIPPIGYIPMGTANDVATTLALPKNNPLEAAKVIINGTPHPYDLGGFGNEGYFAYIAAFGAFTETSYATPQATKRVLGHLAYVLYGASTLPTIEAINTRIEYDEGIIEAPLLYGSMSNSTSVAGIVKLPEKMVCLGDGYSELVLVKECKNLAEYAKLASSVLEETFDSENLIILHTKKAKFIFDKPVSWTRDGENGGSHREIELVNVEAPINFIF